MLTDPATVARGYFSQAYVRQLLDRHLDGSRDNSMQLWALMMFQVWHRELVD